MKKVCSVLLSAVLLVSMLVAVVPSAVFAASASMTLTVDTYGAENIAKDEQFTVSISTSEVESIAAISMRLLYDNTLMTPVSHETAGYLAAFDMVDVNYEPLADMVSGAGDFGVIAVSALKYDTIAGAEGEVILNLTFKALSDFTADSAIVIYEADATTIDAEPYELTMVDGGVDLYRGVIEKDGEYYFYNSKGVLQIGTVWVTEAATNGLVNKGNCYTDETGRFYNNEFVTVNGVLCYMEKGQPTTNTGVREIDGNLYSLNYKGQVNIGEIYVTAAGSNGLVTEGYCYTDETGRFYNNEFATLPDGVSYYMVNGRPLHGEGGVREIDGDLYYISWRGTVVTGTVFVSNGNGYTERGNHYTDETGRFYNNEFVTLDGVLYYMVKGRPMQNGGGVEMIDGELYYITWKGTVLIGEIYVSNGNGYTERGRHYTDETGRFYNEEFVTMDDKIYYLVNGRIYNTPGVIEVDGELYYATWEGPIATGEVYVTYTNGLIETTGWHFADETGRFLDNEFTLASDGKTYYVVKGAKYTTGGVLEVDGNYYYVSWNSSIVINGTVNITTSNSNGYDVPTGRYTTDENGIIQF